MIIKQIANRRLAGLVGFSLLRGTCGLIGLAGLVSFEDGDCCLTASVRGGCDWCGCSEIGELCRWQVGICAIVAEGKVSSWLRRLVELGRQLGE